MALFWWEKKMEKTPWIQNDYNAKSGEWYKLQQSVEHFKETPITRSQLKAFRVSLRQRTGRNGQKWSAAYVNRIVAMVGQVYHWCISQEVFDYKSAPEKERKRYGDIGSCVELDNPTHGLPVLTEEPAEAIIPTQEQFAEFLAALAPEYRNMAIIGVHTGLRRRNVVNMLKEHVDQVGGKLWVPDHKGSGSLRIALHPEALAVLRDVILGDQSGSPYVFHRLNGDPYRSFRGAWRKACLAAGIDGFQFRHLRNTYASWRVEEGVEIGLIQRSLGHTTSAMTSKHYNKAQNATEIILRTQRAINAG
jgi:integrase